MKSINIFLLMLTFLSAQGTKFGDKAIDGYIGFPTITYTKTTGTLSSYYDGEIRDTKNWAKGEGNVDSRGGFAIESLDGETVKFISAECWTENGNECECHIRFGCK